MKSFGREGWKGWLLTIASMLTGIMFIAPLYLVFINSVKSVQNIFLDPLRLPVKLQWENFVNVWNKIDYWKAFLNSAFCNLWDCGIDCDLFYGGLSAFKESYKKK